MRTFQRALLTLSLALLCGSAGWAQSNETFSAGAGGAFDASVCNDPKIAVNAAAQKATPYHDATPTGQLDPLLAALSYLGQKDGLPYLNRASVCLHAPGVVFMVPNNLVGQVTTLVGEIEASEPGGDAYNASANGQPTGSGQVSGGTSSNGGPPGTGGTATNGGPTPSGTPCEPNYDMSTPAGRAAAMQNAAQTKQACDEYLCKHNPELLICQNIGVPGPPAPTPKPIPQIVPGPPAPAPAPAPKPFPQIVPGPPAPAPAPAPKPFPQIVPGPAEPALKPIPQIGAGSAAPAPKPIPQIVPGSAAPASQPTPIVPGPATPAPQSVPLKAGPTAAPAPKPTGPGTPVHAVTQNPVLQPPAAVPPAATPPPAKPAPEKPVPPQQVNLWKGQIKCDGKNCVFVDTNGIRYGGPQFTEYPEGNPVGNYQIDPPLFRVNRSAQGPEGKSLAVGVATFHLINLLPGAGSAPSTITIPFNRLP